MILLEAATSRVATATAQFGLDCAPERSLKESARMIRTISSGLHPIALPEELRAFWVWWAAEDFCAPAFDGFFSPAESMERRAGMIEIGFPEMLIPIAQYGRGLIWAELQSDVHPGSRIYYGGYADPELKLWTIGISGLFELLADAIEMNGVNTWAEDDHRLNPAIFHAILNAHHIALGSPKSDWRIPVADSSQWPDHWKEPTTT